MTKARRRPATELGLRPASPSDRSSRRRSFLIVPLALILLGLLIGVLRLTGPEEELYPIAGDSERYHRVARGFADLYSHPLEGFRLWISRGATEADLQRYGFDHWALQHAPAYTAFLGLGYALPADDQSTGRFLTILLFAIGAALVYLLGREIFGRWVGLAAAIVYLFWPAQWFYGPAILTEIPVATASLIAAYVMLRTGRSERRLSWFLGGVAVGVLVLTKTTLRFLAIPIILLELFLETKAAWGQRLRRTGVRLAGWGATQLIWFLFLWGFQLSANPLAGTGDDWLWIYRGNYVPDRGWETVGIGDPMTQELEVGMAKARYAPADGQREVMYKEAFKETFRRYPGGMLALAIAKAEIFWRFPAVKTFVRAGPLDLPPPARVQPVLALAAILGFVLCIGSAPRRCLPAAIPIYLTLLHAATHLVSRYNIPAMPFAFVYGIGGIAAVIAGLRGLLDRFRRDRVELLPGGRRIARPVAAAVAGVVVLLVALRIGGALALVGPWLAGAAALPLAIRLLGGGRLALARALVLLVVLAGLATGHTANRSDPDEGRIRLQSPGDGARLVLSLPEDAAPERFVGADLMLDLLPSERGRCTLSVRLNGVELTRYEGRPPSGPEAFLLDEEIHQAGNRYRRVLRSVERHLEGCVRKRPGMSDAGYDYYRQWYRVACDPEIAFAEREAVLEIVLLETDGGFIDLFVDRAAPATGLNARRIMMPAFFENPYKLSSYRFDALATNRILADARLDRSIPVASQRMSAALLRASGDVRPLRGEPRMRLRGRLPGGYGLVRAESGELHPRWLADLTPGTQRLAPAQLRRLQADRGRYFDGYVTY